MTWTILIALPLAALVALFAIRPLRRAIVTRPLFAAYRRMLPQMSQTEKEALDAGTVWWEGELFHGRPDWSKLLAYPQPKLTAEEQSFLDNGQMLRGLVKKGVLKLCKFVTHLEPRRPLAGFTFRVSSFMLSDGRFPQLATYN